MVGMGIISSSSSSSTSSCCSLDSFNYDANTVKFLCSYGGRILPRYPDGKLRYVGGDTRVLAVNRSIPFSELQAKMMSLCGSGSPPPVTIRCQLPTQDLDDALVSLTSDEDLANLCEEYDLAGRDKLHPLKIRAFLFPATSSPQSLSPPARPPAVARRRCVHQVSSGISQHAAGDPRFQGYYSVLQHRNQRQ